MEATVKTQIKVGIFVVLGVFALMISIFMLGANSSLLKSYARIHADFDQVQGLGEGSVVSLSGVVVGNVEKILFVPQSNRLDVVMSIDRDYLPRITEGAQVEIRTQGALGDKYIYILPGDPKAAPVNEGARLQVAKASDVFGIFSERGQETEKVFDIINEVLKITKTLNAENRLDRMVENLSTASENLKLASAQARQVSQAFGPESGQKIKSSIERLDSVMGKIDRGEGTLGALINDPALHEQLKNLLGGSTRRQHMKSLIRTSIEKSEGR